MLFRNASLNCHLRHIGLILSIFSLLVTGLSRQALAESGMSAEARVQLAQFSYAGARLPETLAWLGGLGSPAAKMLRAKALIGTGRTIQAIPILEDLTRGELYRGEAWLLLAETSMEGYSAGAIDRSLENAVSLGHGEIRERAMYYQAEAFRREGQPDQAGQVLAKMPPGYWAALGYQNMASDYSRLDRSPSRALVALRVALAMAEEDVEVERKQALKSELLFQAGYLAYQSEDFPKAENFLKGVSLDSFVTPQALYFHGLSLAGRQNYREAMQSWHRAKKFPLALPGVADAWLGMGRGYDELGYLGQAGDAFLAANAAFDSERVTLKSMMEEVRQQGAWTAMVEVSRATDLEWFLADSHSMTQPRQAYLLRFAESRDGQDAINRVADLQLISDQLASQRRDLDIFSYTIRQQLALLPNAQEIGAHQSAVENRMATLVADLRTIAETGGAQSSSSLKGLAGTLADIKAGYQDLSYQVPAARQQLSTLAAQVEEMDRKIGRLTNGIESVRREAEKILDDQTLTFLQREDDRIQLAQERAEQHVAYLYEHLALQGLEQGGRQ